MKKYSIAIFMFTMLTGCETQTDWKTRIGELKGLNIIQKECYKYTSELYNSNEIIKLGLDTTIAPLYFSIILYPKISAESLNDIENKFDLNIPRTYREFLTQLNGAFFRDISLYGIPKTYIKNGLTNRQELEPLNLVTANDTWIKEINLESDNFLFGASSYNDSVNINYCFKNDTIVGYLDNGEAVNKWHTIDEMLKSELIRLKKE